MRTLFNSRILCLLAFAFIFLQTCSTSDDEDPGGGTTGPDELPSLADLVGRWGITSEVDAAGNTVTMVPCENTLELSSSGNFIIVQADRGSFLEGNAAFNNQDSTLTLTIGTEVIALKLLSVTDGTIELQFESDNGPGQTTVNVNNFVKLESEDCASIDLATLVNKWSISTYTNQYYELQGEGDEIGEFVGSVQVSDIPANRFSTQFRTDGFYTTIDLVNEFDWSVGGFRQLDNQNLILTIVDDDGEAEDQLAHLKSIQGNTAVFQTVQYTDEDGDDESRIVTEFTMTINDATVPTISDAALQGKWSASAVVESAFVGSQLVNEEINDNIPHNKMTLDFREEEELLFIDMVSGPQIRLGEYVRLDASNFLVVIDSEDEDDDDEEDEPEYEIFQVTENEGDNRISLTTFEPGDDGNDFDLATFELRLTKNTGDEPSIDANEIIANWEVTTVERLRDQATDDGPVVGMQIEFDASSEGLVSLNGQPAFEFIYEFLDISNLLLTFEGEEEEDDDDGDEEVDFNLFHINSRPGNGLEIIIYSIRGPNDDSDDEEDDEDSNMQIEFRIVLEELDG